MFMKKQLAIFLLILYLFNSVDSKQTTTQLRNYVKGVIESIRDSLKDGIPSLEIPSMEPLVVPEFSRKELMDSLAIAYTLNLELSGLTKFKIEKINVSSEENWIEVDFSLPLLKFEGYYDLEGTIYSIFPLEGRGNLTGSVQNVRIFVRMDVIISSEKATIKDIKLTSKFENPELDLQNFLQGAKFAKMLKPLFNSFIFKAYRATKPRLEKDLNTAIIQKLNEKLLKNENIESLFLGAFS